ncbi:hypothetical protein HJG60_011138 [Phyllostomus discolor]|uniref:Uncharacterized protein n=1 Tax=Phyllostomus discolor TaxID=89673 RepID=A0A834E533_9CHIR|nr:hypothetical protein HJG60_011138 [Phyllostomus discolor]
MSLPCRGSYWTSLLDSTGLEGRKALFKSWLTHNLSVWASFSTRAKGFTQTYLLKPCERFLRISEFFIINFVCIAFNLQCCSCLISLESKEKFRVFFPFNKSFLFFHKDRWSEREWIKCCLALIKSKK